MPIAAFTLLMVTTLAQSKVDLSGDWGRDNAIVGNYKVDYSKAHAWSIQGLCYKPMQR